MYSTVVLYMTFWPQIITPKPARYLLSDSSKVLVRHSQAQKCLQINSKHFYQIVLKFKKKWFSRFFYWLTYVLTYLLMPSGKHNLRMARVRGLIFSLINIASSRDVPFHQSQQLQCLDQGATFVPHWSLIHSSQLCKVTIYIMASVQGIKIAEGLLTLCLAHYVMKWVQYLLKLNNYGFHISRYVARVSRAYFPYFL